MRNTTLLVVALLCACATSSHQRYQSRAAERASTAAAEALMRGDYGGALREADHGLVRDAADPWLLYNRGLALAGLGRTDDALEVLRDAERNFDDSWGKSLAVYRRALALEFAGRCEESSTELGRYAAMVRGTRPELAQAAMAHVEFCIGVPPDEVASRDRDAQAMTEMAMQQARAAQEASTASVRAMVLGDYQLALLMAEHGLAEAPDDPWLLYNKGAALAGLGRDEESLATLHAAERRFDAHGMRGRSLAIYRRALVLESAGRCEEEAAELASFAALTSQPQTALHARAHLNFCRLVRASQIF